MLVETLNINSWDNDPHPEIQHQAITALENGKVLYLPNLAFSLQEHEVAFLSPDICTGVRKNICFDLRTDKLSGFSPSVKDPLQLQYMLHRYAQNSRKLLQNLFPIYDRNVVQARTSYRPVEIAGRIPASFRKDDTRLHVDSFPASPTQGRRILRAFSNVNPNGQARIWRLGESFANVVKTFAPHVPKPFPGFAQLLKTLKITRGYRSQYDHYMLNMHDLMKSDLNYQQNVAQQEFHFMPGSTWFVYTDQVSHAAMSGQYVFEQTFHLPVDGLHDQNTAPLRVLEKFLNKSLLKKPQITYS